MKTIYITLLSAIILLSGNASAQMPAPYSEVDAYVESIGALDTLNAGTISHIVTRKFQAPADKVRAIYYWITRNISPDLRAARGNSNEKMVAETVLKTRKANPSGFANLFQDMCSVAKIRCLTVEGFMKKHTDHVMELPDEFNHTWAVVQLGQSPDTWYYVDPYSGCGTLDEKNTKFTRAFNPDYFFAPKTLFNFQHFPDNKSWQLGSSGPGSLKEFQALPLLLNAAYTFGVTGFTPVTGMLKASVKKPVSFSLRLQGNNNIELVALQVGADKKRRNKTVDFSQQGSSISFQYRFEEEDSYPVTVYINNQPVLTYFAEISE
jgi:hypothetical protein